MNLIEIARRVDDPTGDGREGFEVTTDDLYPSAIDDLREALQYDVEPKPGPLLNYYRAAKTLPDEAWEYAQKPRTGMPEEARRLRATVLELARLWFTELVHETVEHRPMYLRIRKGAQDWRL